MVREGHHTAPFLFTWCSLHSALRQSSTLGSCVFLIKKGSSSLQPTFKKWCLFVLFVCHSYVSYSSLMYQTYVYSIFFLNWSTSRYMWTFLLTPPKKKQQHQISSHHRPNGTLPRKKWLRDQVLQYVDPKYAVSPPAPPRHCPEALGDHILFYWSLTDHLNSQQLASFWGPNKPLLYRFKPFHSRVQDPQGTLQFNKKNKELLRKQSEARDICRGSWKMAPKKEGSWYLRDTFLCIAMMSCYIWQVGVFRMFVKFSEST